jgi:hypothetical protein
MFRLSGCSDWVTVRDLVDRHVRVRFKCLGPECGHERSFDGDGLLAIGEARTLGQLAAGAKCSSCGSRAGMISTTNARRGGGDSA